MDGNEGQPQSGAPLYFVPATPKGALRLLSEACNEAIDGWPPRDAHVWVKSDGETMITLPGIASDEEGQQWIARFAAGHLAIGEALAQGRLSAVVESRETGTFYRIPRFYWFQVRPTDSDGLRLLDGSGHQHIEGQPILVDESHADDWRHVVSSALSRLGLAPNAAPRDEPATVAQRGTLPPSAKPNDHRHAEFAHAAAVIVRQEKIRPQAAFRRVAPTDATRTDDAIIRAIRSAFDLMYHPDGTPIKN